MKPGNIVHTYAPGLSQAQKAAQRRATRAALRAIPTTVTPPAEPVVAAGILTAADQVKTELRAAIARRNAK